MAAIKHTVDIHKPKEVVYKAVSTQEGLAHWWTTDVTAESKIGGKAEFGFPGAGFHATMKITELMPNKKVVWECIDSVDEWLGSQFTFELIDKGENTMLFFTQDYSSPISDEEYGRFNFNWGYYLHSLKDYCESGKGKPYGS